MKSSRSGLTPKRTETHPEAEVDLGRPKTRQEEEVIASAGPGLVLLEHVDCVENPALTPIRPVLVPQLCSCGVFTGGVGLGKREKKNRQSDDLHVDRMAHSRGALRATSGRRKYLGNGRDQWAGREDRIGVRQCRLLPRGLRRELDHGQFSM
jgi:hypothetical protein